MKKQSQAEKFVDKARELGCDEREVAFDSALKTLAGTNPTRVPKQKRKRKKS